MNEVEGEELVFAADAAFVFTSQKLFSLRFLKYVPEALREPPVTLTSCVSIAAAHGSLSTISL